MSIGRFGCGRKRARMEVALDGEGLVEEDAQMLGPASSLVSSWSHNLEPGRKASMVALGAQAQAVPKKVRSITPRSAGGRGPLAEGAFISLAACWWVVKRRA